MAILDVFTDGLWAERKGRVRESGWVRQRDRGGGISRDRQRRSYMTERETTAGAGEKKQLRKRESGGGAREGQREEQKNR